MLFKYAVSARLQLEGQEILEAARTNQGANCLLFPGGSCKEAIEGDDPRARQSTDICVHLRCGGPVASQYERLITSAKKERDEKWKCTDCEKEFAKKSSFQHHVKTHGEKDEKCSLCDYVCSDKSNMRKHKNSLHVNMSKACSDCGRKISDPSNMKAHKKLHHSGPHRVFNCTVCDFSSRYKISVVNHQKIHMR